MSKQTNNVPVQQSKDEYDDLPLNHLKTDEQQKKVASNRKPPPAPTQTMTYGPSPIDESEGEIDPSQEKNPDTAG